MTLEHFLSKDWGLWSDQVKVRNYLSFCELLFLPVLEEGRSGAAEVGFVFSFLFSLLFGCCICAKKPILLFDYVLDYYSCYVSLFFLHIFTTQASVILSECN